jgi:hypothetical protein
MSDNPEAMRKRNMAAVRPLMDWAKTKDRSDLEGASLNPALPPWERF